PNGCWTACGTGTGPTRCSTPPRPGRSRFGWTAVRRAGWRVGSFQVQPVGPGLGGGGTRSPLRARPPTACAGPPEVCRPPSTRCLPVRGADSSGLVLQQPRETGNLSHLDDGASLG